MAKNWHLLAYNHMILCIVVCEDNGAMDPTLIIHSGNEVLCHFLHMFFGIPVVILSNLLVHCTESLTCISCSQGDLVMPIVSALPHTLSAPPLNSQSSTPRASPQPHASRTQENSCALD